jgi:hypothetical protein
MKDPGITLYFIPKREKHTNPNFHQTIVLV